ncbi:hypothetical protein SAMN05444401_3563 [Clostridium amylolyticum]|uniref:ClpX-type ZB domain-containing protein n=1 Tax=Clostridium amylolyticum TaxID=1121298 RepID=A0A1M6L0R0_9CLOT|nr:hypothetical protein [Clostridium amylolyticum]SHJ64719.1 hypothetical protein SAMN05444401_3563 [Clostridium amylolyticum]
MKIIVSEFGWRDKCCGCCRDIQGTEKVYMLTNIVGISGSIHLCEECIDEISKSKKLESIKN